MLILFPTWSWFFVVLSVAYKRYWISILPRVPLYSARALLEMGFLRILGFLRTYNWNSLRNKYEIYNIWDSVTSFRNFEKKKWNLTGFWEGGMSSKSYVFWKISKFWSSIMLIKKWIDNTCVCTYESFLGTRYFSTYIFRRELAC